MSPKEEFKTKLKSGTYILRDLFAIKKSKKPKRKYERKRNFMRIRIRDPNPELWYSLKKIKGQYYIVSEQDYKGHKFITLDIGQIEEKGIQGIAFIRGVPKIIKLKIGDKIKTQDWRSQSIRVEYKRLKVSPTDIPEKQIQAVYDHYETDIINFLEREYGKDIIDIEIVPKDVDFQLKIYFEGMIVAN